jgi:hypothetical protein
MNKEVWYGIKNNSVAFANSQNTLVEAGATNPQSFTVQGDISGLNLIDDNNATTGSNAGAAQPTA